MIDLRNTPRDLPKRVVPYLQCENVHWETFAGSPEARFCIRHATIVYGGENLCETCFDALCPPPAALR